MDMSYGVSRTLLGVIAVAGMAGVAQAATHVARPTDEHVAGEIVVKLRDSTRAHVANAIQVVEKRLGTATVLGVRTFRTDSSFQVIRISKDAQLQQAIAALKADPSVEIAEPNFRFHTWDDGTPNDPDFSKTWGIKNTGQIDAAGQAGKAGADINILPLWQEGFKGDRRVLIAVIDTGIAWDHPDLQANLFTNAKEANGVTGKDDDGNGFVDDLHGWNFSKHTNESQDDHNHGSHCAGTIGAHGNNGIGVSGVNWEATLLPVKFLDANGGGSLEGAVEAINYATMMKANIMSNSWGGGPFTESLRQVILKARDAGALFVAAAGNDSSDNDARASYPASYDIDNILAVAATDNRDGIASFSNYGATKVHVAAPGVKVYSTTTKGGVLYGTMSGTSMATPHVAGIAALMMGADSSLTYGQIKERLIRTSDPVKGLRRKVVAKGRVNAYNALHDIVPPSNEPNPDAWKWENFGTESAHPYADNDDKKFTITRPGAKFIRVHFEKVEVENRYDKIFVQSPAGDVSEELTGTKTDFLSEYVEGDTVVIRLKADSSNSTYGFKVDRIQVIY